MYLYPLYSSQYIAGNILTLTDFSFFFKPLVHPVIQQALPSFGFVSLEDGKQTFLKGIFLIFPCSIISNFNLTFLSFSTFQDRNSRIGLFELTNDEKLSYTEISIIGGTSFILFSFISSWSAT